AKLNVNTSGSQASLASATNDEYTIGTLTSVGDVNIVSGTVNLESVAGENGTLDVSYGAVANVSGGTDSARNKLGTNTVGTSSALNITSGVSESKNITGSGTVSVGDGTHDAKLVVTTASGNLSNLAVNAKGTADIQAVNDGYTISKLDNAGNVDITNGTVNLEGVAGNEGTLAVSGNATVNVSGSSNKLGTDTVETGSELNIASGSSEAKNITGAGTVNVGDTDNANLSVTAGDNGSGTGLAVLNVNTDGSKATLASANEKTYTLDKVTNKGTVEVTAGNVVINQLVNDKLTQIDKGKLTIAAISGTEGTSGDLVAGDSLPNPGLDTELVLQSGTVNGNLTINSDAKVTLAETGDVTVQSDLTNGGILDISEDHTVAVDGKLANNGTTTNDGTLKAKTLENAGQFTNKNAVEADSVDNSGKLTNAENAEMTVAGDFTNTETGEAINNGQLMVDGVLDNAGEFTNNKTVEAAQAENSGLMTNAAGAEMTVVGEMTNTENGELTNDGTMSANKMTNQGQATNNGQLTVDGALDNAGEFTNNKTV
ncbi:MAG: hypothetical protein IK089_02800, partial [Oxalobacter sp.]|nr:hypothetical protein [Oxalobacter sp.]